MKSEGYSFNADYVKKLTKARFLREFGKVYKHLDLESIYDQIVGRKSKKDEVKVVGEP